MSTPESWGYTPREFDARVRVYNTFKQAEHRRWIIDRVDRLNGPLNRKDKRLWSEADFMGGAVSDKSPKANAELDATEQLRRIAWKLAGLSEAPVSRRGDDVDWAMELRRDKLLAQQMRSKDFDDSQIPKWARMTDTEKKQRGIQ